MPCARTVWGELETSFQDLDLWCYLLNWDLPRSLQHRRDSVHVAAAPKCLSLEVTHKITSFNYKVAEMCNCHMGLGRRGNCTFVILNSVYCMAKLTQTRFLALVFIGPIQPLQLKKKANKIITLSEPPITYRIQSQFFEKKKLYRIFFLPPSPSVVPQFLIKAPLCPAWMIVPM